MGRMTEIKTSPVTKTFKWKNQKVGKDPITKKPIVLSETGWAYYDKDADNGLNNGKTGANVFIEMPFEFQWLESATSFSGWNSAKEKSVYSTEVLDLKNDIMTVKCGEDVIAKGLYNQVKDKVKLEGGKYCQAVYGLMNGEVVRFLMTGSSRDSWFTIAKSNAKLKDSFVVCYDTNEIPIKTGGSYEEPVYKFLACSKQQMQEADNAYNELIEPYFTYMLAPKAKVVVDKEEDTEDLVPAGEEEDNDGEY